MVDKSGNVGGILVGLPLSDDKRQAALYFKISEYYEWITRAMLNECDRDGSHKIYQIVRPSSCEIENNFLGEIVSLNIE